MSVRLVAFPALLLSLVILAPLRGLTETRCSVCHAALREQATPPRLQAEEDGNFDVVVVGGGLSGLSAAFFLKKEFRVLVLEKGERIGGKIRFERFKSGRPHPVAAVRMTEPNGIVRRLLQDLGLTPVRIESRKEVFFKGRFLPPWWEAVGAASLPYPEVVRGRFHRLSEDLQLLHRGFKLTVPIENSERKTLDQYDGQSFHSQLQQAYGSEVAEMAEHFAQDRLGVGAEEVSGVAGWMALGFELEPAFSLKGGLGRLAEALAGILGARIRTGRLVDRVVVRQGWAEVESVGGGRRFRARARAVVLAVPAMVAHRIAPDLPETQRRSLAKVQTSAFIVVALDLSKSIYTHAHTLWTPGLYFSRLVFPGNLGRRGLNEPDPEGQVVVAFVPLGTGEGRASLAKTSKAEILRRIQADLEKVFPGAGKTVQEVRVYRWGHAFPVLVPGFFKNLWPAIDRSEGNLVLGGVETEVASLEGAVHAGHKAARRVRERLQ